LPPATYKANPRGAGIKTPVWSPPPAGRRGTPTAGIPGTTGNETANPTGYDRPRPVVDRRPFGR
ncbi:hypothetical protein, partial [Streptomyces anulatus]|uniref:hypothetical protein n=1 Tax=Streptomyces anulatus TaxID=1892 RepID=UPI0036499F39